MKTSIQKIIALFAVISMFSIPIQAQDKTFVRSIIDSLCSPAFQGRGYVEQGDRIAANFIAKELQQTKAAAINGKYLQPFPISINTFPSEIALRLDKQILAAGKDFVMGGGSPGLKGSFKTIWLNDKILSDSQYVAKFIKSNLSKKVIILDTGYTPRKFDKLFESAAIVIAEKAKPYYDINMADKVPHNAYLSVSRGKIPTGCKKMSIRAENVFSPDYQTQNVVAMIRGSKHTDSSIVFTAHYDHLGRMGDKAFFPGANDNASGCAMLLDLARYYSLSGNEPEYNVVFLFFSAEELGILGSKYFTENPLIPLSTIKILINLDMVSTGSEGIKVVNGAVLKQDFEKLTNINTEHNLLKTVSPRGEAANSDHYWFYKKGVPAFFIYTLGKEWTEYHSLEDAPQGLPLTEYDDLFKLVTLFVKQIH
jgi:aminopeptidase YwaD